MTRRLIVSLIAIILSLSLGCNLEADDKKSKVFTSYKKALAAAKKSGRIILVDFTGSDWCSWCIRLKKEALHKKEFLAFAEKNLIILQLDFPQKKKLSKSLENQNKALAKKFKVTGYPTIVFLNNKGREIGRSGFEYGGAKHWIKKSKAMIAKTKSGASSRPSSRPGQ